jgi:hydroxyacylglutathione hydrolase
VVVYGGRHDGVEAVDREVAEGDEIVLGEATKVAVLATPCHTPGHVCYVARCDGQAPAAFTGDT